MTRGQVARRLGKSLATVRRLEGILLHPERDARGVHHFAENEVEALADRIARGDVTVWQELRGGGMDVELSLPYACRNCAEIEEKLAELRLELEEQENRFRRQLGEAQRRHEVERAQLRSERVEFERDLRSFIDALESA